MTEFFEEQKIYKAINCTLVTLIPKSAEAKTVKDMLPISCCSTILKIISKILTDRLSNVINLVVDDSQYAFLMGKNIHDNIFLAQEMVKGYGRKGCSPRCLIQMDIQKAYDTVEWGALEAILKELGFPGIFIRWIMLCVTSV